MRDIGDEIAAHAVELFALRDVAHLHQAVAAGIGQQVDGKEELRVARRVQAQRQAEIAAGQIGDEDRLAHQVGDRLAAVGADVEAELPLGDLVAPADAVIAVERDDAIDDGLAGGLDHHQIVVAARDGVAQFLSWR